MSEKINEKNSRYVMKYPYNDNNPTLYDGRIHNINPLSLYSTSDSRLYIMRYVDNSASSGTMLTLLEVDENGTWRKKPLKDYSLFFSVFERFINFEHQVSLNKLPNYISSDNFQSLESVMDKHPGLYNNDDVDVKKKPLFLHRAEVVFYRNAYTGGYYEDKNLTRFIKGGYEEIMRSYPPPRYQVIITTIYPPVKHITIFQLIEDDENGDILSTRYYWDSDYRNEFRGGLDTARKVYPRPEYEIIVMTRHIHRKKKTDKYKPSKNFEVSNQSNVKPLKLNTYFLDSGGIGVKISDIENLCKNLNVEIPRGLIDSNFDLPGYHKLSMNEIINLYLDNYWPFGSVKISLVQLDLSSKNDGKSKNGGKR